MEREPQRLREHDEVVVAGDQAYQDAHDFMRMLMPSHARNVINYKDAEPLFARFRVEPDASTPKDWKKQFGRALRGRPFAPLEPSGPDERTQGFVELADNDPNLLANLQQQLQLARQRRDAAKERLEALNGQVSELERAMPLGIEAARRAGMEWIDVRPFHSPRRITGR